MPMELILNKKGMCLPRVSPTFKKISPKTFGPHCVCQYLKYSFGSDVVLKLCKNYEVPRQRSCNFLQIFGHYCHNRSHTA